MYRSYKSRVYVCKSGPEGLMQRRYFYQSQDEEARVFGIFAGAGPDFARAPFPIICSTPKSPCFTRFSRRLWFSRLGTV